MELRAPWNGYDNRASNWWGLLDDDAILHGLPSREPRFQWISVDTLSALSVTILPIELKDRTDLEGEQESLITLCSFDARWAKATIQLDPRSSSLIQSSISATGSLYNKKKSEADIRMAHDISAQVILPSNFLDALNPISNSPKKNMSSITSFLMETTKITNRNNTHFNIRMDAIPQYGTASFTKYCRDVEDLIGTATGALIADGMARYTYTSLKPWLELRSSTLADGFEYIDLLDANLTGYPQNTSTTFGNSTKEKAYFIEFTASRYGYSYGFISADRSVQVAVCSICIYVFIIVIYLGAMLARRIFGQYRTSSAWDNISSIVDLALNSVVPPYVVDMGAVHTAASGRQRAQNCNDLLKAREFNGNRVGLEKSNSDEGSGEKIIPGKKY
jgi:hypothetical protein